MLIFVWLSKYFNEWIFYCFVGEFWVMLLFIVLIMLFDGGCEWGWYLLIMFISGYFYFYFIVIFWILENIFDVKKWVIVVVMYNVIV